MLGLSRERARLRKTGCADERGAKAYMMGSGRFSATMDKDETY